MIRNSTHTRIFIQGIAIVALIQFVACSSPKKAISSLEENDSSFTDDPSYYQPTTDPNANMNSLFNDQTTEEEAPDTFLTEEPVVTEEENECLTNGSWAWDASCLSNANNGTNYDQLFSMSIGTYQNMDRCVQIALTVAPKADATQAEVQMAFIIARMALVRCFRNIARWQRETLPWNPFQSASYGYMDQNLWGYQWTGR